MGNSRNFMPLLGRRSASAQNVLKMSSSSVPPLPTLPPSPAFSEAELIAARRLLAFFQRVRIRQAWRRCVHYCIMRSKLDGRVQRMRLEAQQKKA